MIPPRKPFLERATYRQRRLRDAAKMLPILGIALWLVPLLWQSDPVRPRGTAMAVQYVFVIWLLLIVLAAWIASRLRNDETPKDGG